MGRGRAVLRRAALLFGAALFPVESSQAQTIEVEARDLAAPLIRLKGFPPNSEVEVSFTRTAPDGKPPAFRSKAVYRVSSGGNVDLSTPPTRGDWTLALREAPFWTMREDPSAPIPDAGKVLVEARTGAISRKAEFRLTETPDVVVEPVAQFPGALLARPRSTDAAALPLIVILGGSGGDARDARRIAPLFAAQGFAALGLPYISPPTDKGQAIPGLPSVFSRVPVERLEQVYRWASADSRVDATRIGLWGFSKGAEFAIIAAANYPWLDAVAAIAPSDVVWEGFSYTATAGTGTSSFTLNGRPLPFVPYGAAGRGRDVKEVGRRANPARAAQARIPIERFSGSLLVAGGERDDSWDSAGMSQSIAERRAEAGQSTVALVFPDVGHDLRPPSLHPLEPAPGGSAEAVGQAQLKVWEATVAMFKAALIPAAQGKDQPLIARTGSSRNSRPPSSRR